MPLALREMPLALPQEELLSLLDIKHALRIGHDLDDSILGDYIAAARSWLEVETGQIWATTSYEWLLDTFPCDETIALPVWPVQSVSSIKYFDANNVEQTWASANYLVDTVSSPGRIHVAQSSTWPSAYTRLHAVTIAFNAGYSADRPLPARYFQLLRLAVADLYEHREANIEQRLQENQAFRRMIWSSKFVTLA